MLVGRRAAKRSCSKPSYLLPMLVAARIVLIRRCGLVVDSALFDGTDEVATGNGELLLDTAG